MTNDQKMQFDAKAKNYEPVFIRRMGRIINNPSELVIKDRPSLFEINTIMLGLIEYIFLGIPDEGYFIHKYNVCTIMYKVKYNVSI
jgi:hypothetical protein